MKSILKRSLSFLLAITLVFSSAYVGLGEVDFDSIFAVKAEAANSGKCGENLTWTLDSTGTLTITGTGKMYNYNFSADEYGILEKTDIPWYGNPNITKVVIKYGVSNICDGAFYNCENLLSVTMGNSVTSIGCYAFYICRNLTAVTIPNGLKSIGDFAFGGCSVLASIAIPNSVTTIGCCAFNGCRKLSSVELSNSITSIGESTFAGCRSLGKIKIPDSVTSIGDWAFGSCLSLTSIKIPNGVKSIGDSAFLNCEKLASITIPNSVKEIGMDAFWECGNLEKVYITDIAAWCKIDFGLSNANPLYFAKKLYVNNKLVTHLVLPKSVTSISDYAFYNCTSLTSLVISDNVEEIGRNAFYGCTSLDYVFYGGTQKQWEQIISREDHNELLKYTKIHYNATGHVSSTWIIDKKATVNSTGLKHKVCKVCGAKFASTVIPQLKPATPKLSAVTNTVSGVKFTWGKVTGADSYVVYRRTYNPSTKKWGGWVNLAKGIKTTYYVDKTAKSGVYYIYTVKAANEAGYSGFNTTGLKTFFLSTPKLSSVTNSSAGVTVKWGKVAGATNYVVYRKAYNPTTKKWGDWVNVAKGVKTNSYIDKTAKSGVYYIYTVRALAGTNMGSYNTTGLKIYFLSTPVLSKATSTTSGVKFTWGKTAGANGYIVYRRTYNASTKKWNGWSKLATLAGNSKVSYVDKSAKKGVYYIYTTKACCGSYTSAYNTTGLKVKDIY